MKQIQNKKSYFIFFSTFLFLLVIFLPTILYAAPGEPSLVDKVFSPIISLLLGILWLITSLINVAAVLFGYVVDAKSFSTIMNNPAIKTSWIVVRDVLNIAFILVLLFSAFATIFQIEKFHVKKILLTLIIMALLVNFSYPISRFIIDTANIPMYHIATVVFGEGADWMAVLAGESGLGDLFKPAAEFENQQYKDLLAAILFSFIFLITLMALSVLFLIRLVVLIILVIFSPLGFVAAILPSTKNYADDYWTALMKNAFFGPIMMLMLALSIFILKAFQSASIEGFASGNAASTSGETALAQWAFAFVPVVILWGGIIWSQKLGAVGASLVMSKVDSYSRKSWGGVKPILWAGDRVTGGLTKGIDGGLRFLGYNRAARVNSAYNQAKAVPSAVKKVYWDDKVAARKQEAEDARNLVTGRLPLSGTTVRNAHERLEQQQIQRKKKENEEKNYTMSNYRNDLAESNDKVTRIAAAQGMAQKGFTNIPDIQRALQASRGDLDTQQLILQKIPKELASQINPDQIRGLSNNLTNINTLQENQPGLSNADAQAEIDTLRNTFDSKLRENLKVKNTDALVQSLSNIQGNTRLSSQILKNADAGALRNLNTQQTIALRNTLTDRARIQTINPHLDATEVDAEIEEVTRSLRNALRDAGRIDLYIDSELDPAYVGTRTREQIVNTTVRSMDNKSLGSQNEAFYRSQAVQNNFANMTLNNPQRFNDVMTHMSNENLNHLQSPTLLP
ncbi:MAG: hypothetical protein IPN70_02540 [Candidatus Moraniibacteriota bacterium]|nr:MAG: hypothetical protein IPN70_02540 [Candidatus Moranbacteria bacterium]